MSSMTIVSGVDQFVRNDAARRRNAEVAYNRTEKYNGDIQATLEKLERLLLSDDEEIIEEPKPQVLDAGQMKQISLPLGKSLLETIEMWREIRGDIFSQREPTANDIHLANTASVAIRQAESDVISHKVQQPIFTPIEISQSKKWQEFQYQKQFERAISSYSFQLDMQKRGFMHEWPSIYQIA